MKATVVQKAGGPVDLETRERPIPGPDEVLIRVHACGVCHGDLMVRDGNFPFGRYPLVPGHEIAGTVEACGGRVQGLARGARGGLSALFSSCGSCPRCIGAERFIHVKSSKPAEALRKWEGGADLILATAPDAETMSAPFPGLAVDGTMLVVGAPFAPILVSPMDLIMGRKRLTGSPAGARKDLLDRLAFAAAHGVPPRVKRIDLPGLAKSPADMDKGHMSGRVVVVMQ